MPSSERVSSKAICNANQNKQNRPTVTISAVLHRLLGKEWQNSSVKRLCLSARLVAISKVTKKHELQKPKASIFANSPLDWTQGARLRSNLANSLRLIEIWQANLRFDQDESFIELCIRQSWGQQPLFSVRSEDEKLPLRSPLKYLHLSLDSMAG